MNEDEIGKIAVNANMKDGIKRLVNGL